MKLNVWKLHPQAARLERAEKTLHGLANPSGVKFCVPFTSANRLGWWLYPPVNVDICWRGGSEFEHRMHEPFGSADHLLLKSLLHNNETILENWCPEAYGRSKFTFGAVEDGVAQIWTGLIFQTPPGWLLHIRSPVNFPTQSFHIMEGILETDWMQYDIWANLVFDKQDEWIEFRKDSAVPLAQIIPIRRETVDESWEIGTQELLNRDTPEANRVFDYYVSYNNKKYCSGGKQRLHPVDDSRKKDSATFHKEKMRCLDRETLEPKAQAFECNEASHKKPHKGKLIPVKRRT